MKNQTRIHTHALHLILVVGIAASVAACGDDSAEPSAGADAVTDIANTADGSADTAVPDDSDATTDTTPEVDAPSTDAEPAPDTVEGDAADDTAEPDSSSSDGSSVEGCLTNADCDNADVCDGEEVCDVETGECSAGTALECTVSSVCNEATCDPVDGCGEALIDADEDGYADAALGECGLDCNDDDTAINPDAEEVCDGVDNDCNPETADTQRSYWADCDGDGFGSAANGTLDTCNRPSAGPTECPDGDWIRSEEASEDCCDRSDRYYPESEATITSIPTIGEVFACEDFDADCDGTELPTRLQRMSVNDSCMMQEGECVGAQGWTPNVPACGVSGAYSSCVNSGGSCTRTSRSGIIQACH